MPVQAKDATAAERKRRQRENLKKSGMARVEEFVPADRVAELREIAKKMRAEAGEARI
jgi:hypothetical protein